MLAAFVILLVLQLIGEITVRALHLPIPGPVLGMILLFTALIWYGSIPEFLKTTSQHLLQHLSLFFVPAGVGIMVHFGLLRAEWWPILLTLLGSTWLTIIVTVWTLQVLLRQWEKQAKKLK